MKEMFTLLILALTLTLTVASDCQFNADTFYYDLNEAIDCMNSIPFNAATAKETIETVKMTMSLYAFRDEIRNSSYGNDHSFLRTIEVDIMKELDLVLKEKYLSHHAFLQRINDIFFRIKDPHTYYVKSSCYGFFAAQPLALSSRMENGKQVIFVDGIYTFSAAEMYKDIPFADYLGATVTLINKKDALETVIEHAHQYGYLSKDPSCNFNFMIESAFQQRSLKVFPFPEPYQAYRLEKNGVITDVVLPWVAIMPGSVSYKDGTCETDQQQRLTLNKWKDMNKNHPLAEILLPPAMRTVHKTTKFEEEPLQAGPSIHVYPVNRDVIALKINDFVPEDNESFLATVNYVLSSAKDKNIDYLILDVRGNGGGDICLGYQVIHRLVEERRPEGRYDIIHSDLMDNIVTTATKFEKQGVQVPIFGPSWWDDINDNIFHNISWYMPGVNHTRGQVAGQYSEKVFHSCDLSEDYPHHLFKKILILSDGTCGSTCAVFTTHLAEVDHVKTVVLGGIEKNSKMQFFSFPGGQVMDYESVLMFQKELKMTGDLLRAFPDDAGLRFTLLEIYPWLNEDPTNLPLEFMFLPADIKLAMWKGNHLDRNALMELYAEIVPQFSPLLWDN